MDHPPTTPPALAPISSASGRIRALWSFDGRYRILHLTWMAFFLSFVVWFNFAPFSATIGAQLGFSQSQLVTLALCNVALTVPARILIGMLLDRFGPRRVYSGILVYAAVPCLVFATASSFSVLVVSRLLLGIVGAGFVVGIRMVAEWFPPKEVGLAEGIYGGWGNFGSAAAAFCLPIAAGVAGGDAGWRWAIATTGLVAAGYGLYYWRSVTDTPEGVTYLRPRRQGALEVTSRRAVWGLAALTVPLVGVLALLAWRIAEVDVLSGTGLAVTSVALLALLVVQLRAVVRVNRTALAGGYPAEDQYPFRSVAVLSVAYFCTFGSELAVVSMLPTFFADTWDLGPSLAGAMASAFAFMNLVSRPAGGLLSDLLGSRRRTLAALLVGLTVGYGAMALLGSAWPVPLAMLVVMGCSFFVQSGEGAVYAIVPLVKKRVSGQIAGMAGAYGNVGAVVFLTVLLYAPPSVFFLVIAAASVVAAVACRWLPEPEASFADDLLVDISDPPVPAAEVAGIPGTPAARPAVGGGPLVSTRRSSG
ncbi:MAG TPA: NarK family nitrate/nitrite MFS transporter [Acidimicrobiales bacterium]|nr:NarK family nitrate/nitrite MFS transporter [Acidimicrobiales bacterium]